MSVPLELSVIIATRNRRALLERCLGSLRGQTQDPGSYEVLVADDGSDDGTAEALEGLGMPFRLRILRLEQGGRAAARNAAIRAAEGRICLTLDDDVIADPRLIAAHVEAHAGAGPVLGIGGLTQALPRARDWYAREFAHAWNRHYEALAEKSVDWTAGYSGNMSAPRSALLEVGGFAIPELRAHDDIELAYRLSQIGCQPRYLPRAHGLHDDQKPRKNLLADSGRQGEIAVELSEQVPAMLPKLLGWFGATSTREIRLRRLLLALRVPPVALAALGPLVPGEGRQGIWFDFVRRFAFWRGVRRSTDRARWAQITRPVPVLLYHAFSEQRSPDRYVVAGRSFARQMRLLSLLRYRVIGFDELARALREHQLPPRRAAVITIDDGYRDNLEVAQPVLRRRGFVATIFLVSAKLGGGNDWTEEGELSGRPLLSVDEVRRLQAEGVRFGAHTRSHCSLPGVPDEQVPAEIRGSREDLERDLGAEVPVFAYPYGHHDERSAAVVERSGFAGAGTTHPRLVGLDQDPALIPRVEIRSSDSLLRFLGKLRHGGH